MLQTSDKNKFNICDLFRFPSLRKVNILGMVMVSIIMFLFFAPVLMIDKFQLNIYVNGAVNGISETLSYPMSYFLIPRVPSKTLSYATFALSAVCAIILIFIWDQDSTEPLEISHSIFLLVLIFFFRFAISIEFGCFMVFYNQMYPTQVRVLGTSLGAFVSGGLLTVIPQILDLCVQAGFKVMIMFTALSILGIVCTIPLDETFGKPPREVIRELAESELERQKTEASGLGCT